MTNWWLGPTPPSSVSPPVDFVFSRSASHQLPDFWKGIALTRIAAILKPGRIFRVRLRRVHLPADVARASAANARTAVPCAHGDGSV